MINYKMSIPSTSMWVCFWSEWFRCNTKSKPWNRGANPSRCTVFVPPLVSSWHFLVYCSSTLLSCIKGIV